MRLIKFTANAAKAEPLPTVENKMKLLQRHEQ